MSNRILKNKLPYSDSNDNLLERFNYLVKTLNSSFLSQSSSDQSSNNSLSGSVEISQPFSAPSGTLFTTFTLNHNLGVIPSGYILSDFEYSSGPVSAEFHSLSRVSWTNTQITVRLNITTGTGSPFSGSFKLLILR